MTDTDNNIVRFYETALSEHFHNSQTLGYLMRAVKQKKKENKLNSVFKTDEVIANGDGMPGFYNENQSQDRPD